MDYPLNIIMQWMADFLLPLTRIAAMLGVMVGIGAKNTPTRIKAGLAVFITILIMPVLPPSPIIELFSVNTVPLVAQQVLVGSAIGFVSVLMMNTFVLAGQIVAMQTGLGFASVVDPVNGLSVAAIGQFYLVLATLLFWVVDGHLAMIHLVVHSFEAVLSIPELQGQTSSESKIPSPSQSFSQASPMPFPSESDWSGL